MSTVTFENVTKKYGDVIAVDDLNLAINDGEFMVLVGPSGCGKTTSLRMIAGLEEISGGRLTIADLQARMGTTFVYRTHEQVEAMTMGTRIAVMSEGLLQQVGTPRVLYDQPANRFVAGFIGSPSMNFLDVTFDSSSGTPTLAGPGGWTATLPHRFANSVGATSGRKLVAGFRPEHLDLDPIEGDIVTLPGRADVVEYLGNEELLHVSAADKDIVAIVGSDHRVKPGDVLTLNLPLTKLHLFDAESGVSLTSEREPVAA